MGEYGISVFGAMMAALIVVLIVLLLLEGGGIETYSAIAP